MTQDTKESTTQDTQAAGLTAKQKDLIREQTIGFIEKQQELLDEALADAQVERITAQVLDITENWSVIEVLIFNRIVGVMLANQLRHIQEQTGTLPPTVEYVGDDTTDAQAA